ncbi:MAG TPA: YhjD/YihY/BrkB family envelope integrity protein [Acidimicrobiales bacterium]|nr:YhjD/YihY/BrkB family envelope integrity protein [Acidimicrobiales bacterium]
MPDLVRSVDVDRPVSQVFDAWSRIEDLPRILPGVASVRLLDERSSHWVVVVARQVDKDLDAFKRHVESSPPVEGHRAAIGIDAGAGTADTPADHVVDAAAASFDDGRGRTADSPTEIPPKGWQDVLKRTFAQVKSDNVPVVAGGVAFYVFLSLIPALLAVILVYGLVADPEDVREQITDYVTALPTDARSFLLGQLERITEQDTQGLGVGLVASVVAAIYSASKGMQGLIAALNVAYDEEETRKFVKLRLTTFGLTLAVIVAGAVGIGGMAILGGVAEDLGTAGGIALTVLRWPLLAAFLILGLAALYRYAPDRDRAKWRWVTPGAAVATVLWVLGSVAFSIYANVAGNFSESYGALSGVAVMLLWLLLSAYVIILGAEFDAEMERQTARDSTKGPRRPLGQRAAYAADTVAAGR